MAAISFLFVLFFLAISVNAWNGVHKSTYGVRSSPASTAPIKKNNYGLSARIRSNVQVLERKSFIQQNKKQEPKSEYFSPSLQSTPVKPIAVRDTSNVDKKNYGFSARINRPQTVAKTQTYTISKNDIKTFTPAEQKSVASYEKSHYAKKNNYGFAARIRKPSFQVVQGSSYSSSNSYSAPVQRVDNSIRKNNYGFSARIHRGKQAVEKSKSFVSTSTSASTSSPYTSRSDSGKKNNYGFSARIRRPQGTTQIKSSTSFSSNTIQAPSTSYVSKPSTPSGAKKNNYGLSARIHRSKAPVAAARTSYSAAPVKPREEPKKEFSFRSEVSRSSPSSVSKSAPTSKFSTKSYGLSARVARPLQRV